MKEIFNDIKYARQLLSSEQEVKQKLKLSDLRIILPYLKKNWKSFLLGGILMLLVSVGGLPSPLLTKYIIDTVIPGKDFAMLNIVLLGMVALYLVKLMLSFLLTYNFERLSQRVLMEIKRDLFARIIKLPLSFFDKNQTGYIMARLGEVSRLRLFFSSVLSHTVIMAFEFIFCLGILWVMNPHLTVVSVAVLPLYYLVAKKYTGGIRRVSQQVMEKGANLSRQFQESIAGVDTIKSFSAEKRETGKLGTTLNELMKTSISQSLISTFSGELMAIVGIVGMYVVLWYSAVEIMGGDFTIGGYLAFSAYLGKLYTPTQTLATLGLTLQPATVALRRVSELCDMEGEDSRADRNVRVTSLNGKIVFENLSFSYQEEGKRALEQLNFEVEPGEKVALIGPNGSGKSTVIKLLMGFYPVKNGHIRIDDMDINTLVLSDLRERISVVSQQIFLFNDTIKENIRYSLPGVGDDRVIEAARLAGAFDFIGKLEKGFDTPVGETGKTLSGGERQKIAIARAILKNADIIIFDEATSNLDAQSASHIETLMENNFQDKTVILIAHRLTRFDNFDRVIRLENGKLQEDAAITAQLARPAA